MYFLFSFIVALTTFTAYKSLQTAKKEQDLLRQKRHKSGVASGVFLTTATTMIGLYELYSLSVFYTIAVVCLICGVPFLLNCLYLAVVRPNTNTSNHQVAKDEILKRSPADADDSVWPPAPINPHDKEL